MAIDSGVHSLRISRSFVPLSAVLRRCRTQSRSVMGTAALTLQLYRGLQFIFNAPPCSSTLLSRWQ